MAEKRSQKLGVAPEGTTPNFSLPFSLTPRGISPSADGDQGAAFGNRKLLKKLDQNFPKLPRQIYYAFTGISLAATLKLIALNRFCGYGNEVAATLKLLR